MRIAGILLLLVFQASAAPKRLVFVVDKISQVASGRAYGNAASAEQGEHHTAPVVMAEFAKKCPSVSFTKDKSTAEFILETQQGASTLLDQKGNVLYISPAKSLKNMEKDVCAFITSH